MTALNGVVFVEANEAPKNCRFDPDGEDRSGKATASHIGSVSLRLAGVVTCAPCVLDVHDRPPISPDPHVAAVMGIESVFDEAASYADSPAPADSGAKNTSPCNRGRDRSIMAPNSGLPGRWP